MFGQRVIVVPGKVFDCPLEFVYASVIGFVEVGGDMLVWLKFEGKRYFKRISELSPDIVVDLSVIWLYARGYPFPFHKI